MPLRRRDTSISVQAASFSATGLKAWGYGRSGFRVERSKAAVLLSETGAGESLALTRRLLRARCADLTQAALAHVPPQVIHPQHLKPMSLCRLCTFVP